MILPELAVEAMGCGQSMAEQPIWGLKCPVCGLGMLSWSQDHVDTLLALHQQAEHQPPPKKPPRAAVGVADGDDREKLMRVRQLCGQLREFVNA